MSNVSMNNTAQGSTAEERRSAARAIASNKYRAHIQEMSPVQDDGSLFPGQRAYMRELTAIDETYALETATS